MPLHNQPNTPVSASSKPTTPQRPSIAKATRLSDVWDEREELFDIGSDSEDDSEDYDAARRSQAAV